MNKKCFIRLGALLLVLQSYYLSAQVDTILIQERSLVQYEGFFSAYSGTFDNNDPQYLYAAALERGLGVYKITDDELFEIQQFPTSDFNNLDVTNVYQVEDLLYLSLGNFQSAFGSNTGIAVLNIADPESITIEGLWSTGQFSKGSAIIKVVEDYAYLGMMDSGMAIVNVANPDSMYYLSHIVPDYFFPATPGLFTKPHTRGMAIRDDIAFLCADAGGLRVIDISDKEQPSEEQKYINEYVFQNAGRAYNNILLDGDVAYVALDYCGLEVLDISDPFDPQVITLLDLWDCANSPWEDGRGHLNELAKVPGQDILFVSGGDSEVIALDISNPGSLKQIGSFGAYQDSVVAWGLDMIDDKIALFQLNNSGIPDVFPQPYYGDQGGVKLLQWDAITPVSDPLFSDFEVRPNPFTGRLNIVLPQQLRAGFQIKLYDQLGQLLYFEKMGSKAALQHSFDFSRYSDGLYYLSIESDGGVFTEKVLKFSK